jgi:predicted Rossmann fold nucleotide-binding protein DprA/Smf involved in DNA uptake
VRLAIVGSRTITDKGAIVMGVSQAMAKAMELGLDPQITEIVSGGAKGVDAMAEDYAKAHGFPTRIFRADWDRHGRRAGFLRNRDIVANCDMVLAIHDGESRGTQMTIDIAKRQERPTVVLYPEDW